MQWIVAAGILAGCAQAEDRFLYPLHQTQTREQRWDIVSVYQDVQSPMVGLMPGHAMTEDAQIRLGYGYSQGWITGLDEGYRDQGRQDNVDVLIRLRACKWFHLEIEGGAEFGDLAGAYDFRNIDARGVITLYDGRYRGGALVFGVGAPVSPDGYVPGYNNKSDLTQLTYIAGLRFTEAVWFNVFHLNTNFRWAPNVVNHIPDDWVKDGVPLPNGQEIGNTYVQAEGLIGWSYRPFRFGRIGAEYQLTWDYYTIEDPQPVERNPTLSNVESIVRGFTEINIGPWVALTGYAGANLKRWQEDGRRSAVVLGGCATIHF